MTTHKTIMIAVTNDKMIITGMMVLIKVKLAAKIANFFFNAKICSHVEEGGASVTQNKFCFTLGLH